MVTALTSPAQVQWPSTPAGAELNWLFRNARAPKLRTMRQFAEQEIILPDGPYKGLRFRCDRQPYSGLYFDAVDSRQWSINSATGPSQSGKTITCTLIPLLYHLFEQRETVGFGIPDKDMAADKWEVDILPLIERSRYKELLPIKGQGSRGAAPRDLVKFRNGAFLKFFSGGGNDKERSHFTTRVLIATEVNIFGKAGQVSEESSKYEQLLARVRAFGDQAVVYQECTQTVETGIVHQAHIQGTASRIVSKCPHCGHYVAPDREQLRGWQTAVNEVEARLGAVYVCPREECAHEITEPERRAMLASSRLVHRGQEILPTGEVIGDKPPTLTLGFRWTAFDNCLMSAADIAADEFKAARAPDEDAAERKLCQFVWARPHKSSAEEAIVLDANVITTRLGRLPRGIVPQGTLALTVGIDLGMHLGHLLAVAWGEGFGGHVVDYARFDVPGRDLGAERAIEIALRQLVAPGGTLSTGWAREGTGEVYLPDQVWVDIGYQQDAVFAFWHSLTAEEQQRFRPAKGYGAGKFRAERYTRPKATSNQVLAIGEHYHFARYAADRIHVGEFSADFWKSFFHARLATDLHQPGALSLFATSPREHLTLAKHFTAEKKVVGYVEGEGDIEKWERVHKNNHYLDCASMATAAAHWCGVRFTPSKGRESGVGSQEVGAGLTLPDGRAFCVLDR